MITKPNITIIIPCRNEKTYIGTVLENILKQDYDQDKIEVLVVDGLSDDGTQDVINGYTNKYNRIILLINNNRIVPCALNIGIKKSADLVMIMGAHAEYPHNYVSTLVSRMERLNADNVGCPMKSVPANNTPKARAIASVVSHPFGVGNAYFRLGVKEPQEVDTVPFGLYKKEIFEKIGYFNEQLVRNQDDELNARLKRHGGKIYLVPGLEIIYYARDTFKKLWKMYFQYGYFKPLVNKKIIIPSNLRQLIPAIFILVLLLSLSTGIFIPFSRYIFIFIFSIYLVTNLSFSFLLYLKRRKLYYFIGTIIGFMVLHFSYGLGYLKGCVDFIILSKEKKINQEQFTPSR